MSFTLREQSQETLQVDNQTYHFLVCPSLLNTSATLIAFLSL